MDTNRKRGLIVDDSQIATRLLEKALEDEYLIDTAEGISTAVKLLTDKRYDFFIIDYMLEEQTGLELVNTIRGMEEYSNPDTVIILISSAMTNSMAYAAMMCGANCSFSKSIDYDVIKEELARQFISPKINEVVLECLETQCLMWRRDNVFYQFSPELGITTKGATKAEAHINMVEKLIEAFHNGRKPTILKEHIELVQHSIRVNNK